MQSHSQLCLSFVPSSFSLFLLLLPTTLSTYTVNCNSQLAFDFLTSLYIYISIQVHLGLLRSPFPPLHVHHKLLSQDPVRVVLVAVVELCRQRIQRVLDQLLHLPLQLLLRQAHVEAVPQIPHRRRAAVLKARQLGT